ncbi:ATP adenylyltransferase-like protein 3 [Elsinoe fawcettii]|nr:ATP adenylyltransferase-like protein 3 [Elsinoe fawcettii]
MDLGLTQSLPALVRGKYDSAKASGALTFSETQLAIVQLHNQAQGNFQLRYCPALQKKPTQQKPEQTKDKKRFNPFENPTGDLLVADVPSSSPTHRLVLNKYPIIPNHFILATREFAQQTDLLEPEDLAVAYTVLKAWEMENPAGKLFAFFNSGSESGASQPHRHLQFVPFEDMQRDVPEGQTWRPLMLGGSPSETSIPELPFETAKVKMSSDITPAALHGVYLELVKKHVGLNASGEPAGSYNLGMTSESLAIAKRTNEAYMYKDDSGIESAIAVNGTILAGTLLVKGEQEWKWLQKDPANLQRVLASLGVSKQSSNRL